MATYTELISITDRDTTLRMVAKFGGRTVSIPRPYSVEDTLQILKLHRSGMDPIHIASSLQLSAATVVDILESCLTHEVK